MLTNIDNHRIAKYPGASRCAAVLCAIILCAIILCAGASPVFSQTARRPTMRMKASPERVYLGDTVRLQIMLDDFDAPQLPDMSYLKDEFDVKYLGAHNRNNSVFSFGTGQGMQKIEEHGITYHFQLTPKKAGTLRINPPEVRIGNVEPTAVPVEIEVVEPQRQDDVRLEVGVSANEVYPLSRFRVTLSIYVKAFSGKRSDIDPIRVVADQLEPARLQIPWLDDDSLPKGLVPQDTWEHWLSAYHSREGGFVVNNIRANDSIMDFAFPGFGPRRDDTLFLPRGKRVSRKTADGKSIEYWRYDFVREFVAETPGPLTFDAAKIKGTFAHESENLELKPQSIYTISDAKTVTVKDVPTEGRPDDYIGAFGQFRWKAALVPEKVHVGEAMTLTLTLDGEGSVLNVKQPPVEKNPEVLELFKVYPPTEAIEKGSAKFTYSLRPIKPGKVVFPAIPVSCFDVETEKFVTLRSAPITIDVEQSEVLSPAKAVGAEALPKAASLKKSSGGIFANRTEPGASRNCRIAPGQWLSSVSAVGGVGVILWALLLVVRSEKLSAFRRRGDLVRNSRNELVQGITLLARDNVHEAALAAPLIKSAFFAPLADLFDKPVATLTESEIRALMQKMTERFPAESALCNAMTELTAHLEHLRYGLDRTTVESLEHEVEPLFERWTRFCAVRANRRGIKAVLAQWNRLEKPGSATLGLVLTLVALLPLCSGCRDAKNESCRARFEQALTLFDEADRAEQGKDKDDAKTAHELFAKSAAVYSDLIGSGIESGPILYNQGNAWFRAGEKAKALAAWRQAKRYMPRDPYLQANIDTVAPVLEGKKGKPTLEIVFLWQNALSYPAKYRLSFVLAVLLVASFLTWRLVVPARRSVETLQDKALQDKALQEEVLQEESEETRRRRAIRRSLARTTLVLAIAFAVMALSALYDWQRFDRTSYIVVSAPDTVARKGNSPRYAAVFSNALPERTEGRLLERKGDWLRVQFADGQDGWIESKDAIVY